MNKAQKIVIGFFIASVLVILGLYILSIKTNVQVAEEDVLYYSLTCPHCKIVEEFIFKNNITAKINFSQKEVSLNTANGKELVTVGTFCKLDPNYIGAIPLFYSNKTCYIGDVDIITILKTKAGIAETNNSK